MVDLFSGSIRNNYVQELKSSTQYWKKKGGGYTFKTEPGSNSVNCSTYELYDENGRSIGKGKTIIDDKTGKYIYSEGNIKDAKHNQYIHESKSPEFKYRSALGPDITNMSESEYNKNVFIMSTNDSFSFKSSLYTKDKSVSKNIKKPYEKGYYYTQKEWYIQNKNRSFTKSRIGNLTSKLSRALDNMEQTRISKMNTSEMGKGSIALAKKVLTSAKNSFGIAVENIGTNLLKGLLKIR